MSEIRYRERRGYARMSRDPRDQKVGVTRQKREGNDRAATMGLPIDRWHVDNDKSAYSGQRRDDFETLLGDIEAGHVEIVFAWDQDRIARDVTDWERFLKACQRTGTRIVFVTSGEQLIGTVSGRTTTRFNAVIARQESEHKSERITAASKERAMKGKAQGRILYGWRRVYDHDAQGARIKGGWRDVAHEEHAAVVQEMAKRVLGGEAIKAIIRDLDARGITSPTGKRWQAAAVRALLLRPANAGLRVYQGEARFEAEAPAILDRGDWDRLVALLKDPTRRTITDNRVRYLLTGIAKCGVCGAGMRHKVDPNGTPRYVCQTRFCTGRLRDPVDDVVVYEVTQRLARPDAIDLLARDDSAAVEAAREAASLRARLIVIGDDYADGEMTRDEWKQMTARIRTRLQAAERVARVTSSRTADIVGQIIGPDARARFDARTITEQRTVISHLVDVRILPIGNGTGGHAPFRPEAIEVTWKGEDPEFVQ